jgi:photosystem II stability/assembly factor-like uncharacterized protein
MKKAEGRRRKAVRGEAARALPACLLLTAFCLLAPPARAEWSLQRSGTMAWLRAVHFTDERTGWAVGGNGALVSTADGGATWQARPRPAADTLRDVFFVDQTTGWLVCERNVFALASHAEARSYLLRTTDGGESWSRVEMPRDEPGVLLARVAFADPARGWVFGEMGALYSTRDGGHTWSRQRTPTRNILLGASFDGEGRRAWLVGAAGTVLVSEDGGAEWRAAAAAGPAERSPRLNAVSFVDARTGWAVGRAGTVLATADGGRTWARQDADTEADLTDVKFFDAREGWAVGDGGTIIHTVDGGRTWRHERSGTRHRLERLSFPARARGWAVGFGGTVVAYTRAAPAAPRLKSGGGP